MHDLQITWPEGSARFSPDDSPVEVGRSPDAAIILTEPSVSRRHIEFVWSGSAWTAADSSTHGSFDPIGVRLAPKWTVGTDTTIRLGGVEGVELRIALVTTRPDGVERPGRPVQAPADEGSLDLSSFDPPAAASSAAGGLGVGAAAASGGLGLDEPAPGGGLFPPDPPTGPDPLAPGSDGLGGPAGPSVFDQPAASGPAASDQILGAPGTAPPGLDQPPLPGPAAFDQPPPGPSAFDQPPPGPSAFDQPPPGPSAFDQPPPGPSAFDQPPPAPSAFDQPPPGPSAFDQPPPAPSAFDQPPTPPGAPEPAGPSILDQPPAPPPGFDQGPPEPSVLGGPPPGPGDPGSPFEAAPPVGPSGLDQPGPGGDIIGNETGAVPGLGTTTSVADATLQLSIDGKDYTFVPGTEVTLGREPSCLVHVDERHSLVSRRHLKITYRDDYWWIEDFSSKGTFVDGKRITTPYKAEGAFIVQLGDDDAGTPLRVITAGEHKAPRKQSLALLIVIGVLAVIAIAALVLALRGGSDDGSESLAAANPAAAADGEIPPPAETETASAAAENLTAAKQATVLLIADDGQGGLGFGSGFFVTDSLIVTNQHVADLDDTLLVAVSRQADEPAAVEFSSRPVAQHPFLDIAVIQLTDRVSGEPVTSGGLAPAALGDSSALTLGDAVFNTGFPANLSLISRDDMSELQLPPVGTTRGEAASFSIWPGCSNPDFEAFIPQGSPPGVTCAPEGDVDRGIVLTTFSSGEGASGSPVFLNNEVIAVVFAGPLDEANAGRAITTDAFRTWLNEIIAANGG